jgi:cytochrome P450
MLLILIFIILFIFVLIKYYDYSNYSKIKNKETGKFIKSESVLSNFYYLFFYKKMTAYRVLELKKKFNENIFGSYFLGRFVVVVSSDKFAKQIISEDSKVFIKEKNRVNLKYLEKLFGKSNVLNANGEDWKRQRSSMNHAFFDLTKYNNIFSSKSEIVYDILRSTPKQEDIGDVMQKMTLDILGKSIFDFEFNSLSNKFQKELNSYNNVFKSLTTPSIVMMNMIKENILGMKLDSKDSDELSDFFDNFINKSREKMKENKEPKSMIDFMLTSNEGGGLTNEEIKSNT